MGIPTPTLMPRGRTREGSAPRPLCGRGGVARMATTREVRRGAWWLRLHQFVLLRSRRNIRSTIGNLVFASEQYGTDSRGHEC